MKDLKDYPLNEWMEAADKCDMCGAQRYVKVTWIDETGDFGEVETKVEHEEYCADLDTSADPVDNSFDFAGWEYSPKVVKIAGREWSTFKSKGNTGICLNCEKFVVGVPLILWPEDGDVEMDFCSSCFEKLGLMELLK